MYLMVSAYELWDRKLKILYYLWIFFTTFIAISVIIYDEDDLSKFRRKGNKLIRL